MYQGPATRVLVEGGFCPYSLQKPQKSYYYTYIRSKKFGDTVHVYKVTFSRECFSEGFGRSSAQICGLGGDVRLKRERHMVLFLLL